MKTNECDVLIIGAGVAGLACARELLRAGRRVRIIEARDRVGGRILTARPAGWEIPAELGAEFIHGVPREVLEVFEQNGLPFYDVDDGHFSRVAGAHRDAGFWEMLSDAMASVRGAGKDRSVAEFLREKGAKWKPEKRALFTSYVQGFHAADLDAMGQRGLAEAEDTGDEELNGKSLFRPGAGYDRFVAALGQGLDGHTDLLTTAREIRWRAGRVEITARTADGHDLEYVAARAVVTLPVGVLRARPELPAGVQFEPRPPQLDRMLSAVHMGHAMRIVCRFRKRFWEELNDKPVSFMHTGPGRDFPTWWTAQPVRAPILTAWQGGPRVAELAALPEGDRVRIAIESLAYLLGMPVARVRRELVSWVMHDWSNDPYSLGAYSYLGIDGSAHVAGLTKPLKKTLSFAGEALQRDSSRGTVHGAFMSGVRSARQILAGR